MSYDLLAFDLVTVVDADFNAWREASTARATFTALAAKHRVAVAMVSDDGSILRP